MSNEDKKKEEFRNRGWPFLLIFFGFTAACIVFAILCIDGTKLSFVQKYKGLMIALAVAFLCILCGVFHDAFSAFYYL